MMSEQAAVLVNRNHLRKSPEAERSEKNIEELNKVTINEALASQFPQWDLKPPAALIKRRSSRVL